MNSPREYEAKFEAGDEAQRELLALESFGEFSLVKRESKVQDDTYYDTTEEHLREAGATLRIRRRPSGAQMTFKGEREKSENTHLVSRLEDEVDLDASAIIALGDGSPLILQTEPGPLIRARAASGDNELKPVARLMTNRSVLLFVDGAGNGVELSIDRCEATRVTDGRTVSFSEVELELKHGEAVALLGAANALQTEVGGLKPSTKTKLARALR
jgi:inorganic triphosphatase YgiF